MEAAPRIELGSLALQAIDCAYCEVALYVIKYYYSLTYERSLMENVFITTQLTTPDLMLEHILPSNMLRKNELTGCINWMGAKDAQGYGKYKQEKVHRLVYRNLVGEIPDKMLILHRCDNTRCCNPYHLQLGTVGMNNKDRVDRGRSNNGENNGQSKITEDDVIAILRHKGYMAAIGDFLGISDSQVARIKNKEQWAFVNDDGRELPIEIEEFLKLPTVRRRNYQGISGENNQNSLLNKDKVIAIRRYTGTVDSIANFLNISNTTVNSVKHGKTWSHIIDNGESLPVDLADFLRNPIIRNRDYDNIRGENNKSAIVTKDIVIAIRRYKGTTATIARYFKISKTTAQEIKKGSRWKHIVDNGQKLPKHIACFLSRPIKVKSSSKNYPENLKKAVN
jgi:hypothetical protein